jgi:hypothetical protein
MKKIVLSIAAALIVALSFSSARAQSIPAAPMVGEGGVAMVAGNAVAAVGLLYPFYLVYATATGKQIGVTPSQKAEADAAQLVMTRYQTVPANLAVAINDKPTLGADLASAAK